MEYDSKYKQFGPKKVKDVIKELKQFDPEAQFLISSDEELNRIFYGLQIAQVEGTDRVIIYGLDGLEEDDGFREEEEEERDTNYYDARN